MKTLLTILGVLLTIVFIIPPALWVGAWILLIVLFLVVLTFPTVLYITILWITPLSDPEHIDTTIWGVVGSIIFIFWKWVEFVAPFLISVEDYMNTHNFAQFFWGILN